MESMKVRLLTIAALAMGILAASAVFSVPPAAANGIHPNAREVYSGAVGPYFLRVTTAPIVGNMHFVVHLSQADGVQPVDDAEIAVWGRPDDANLPPVGPVDGIASLDGPNLFTVDLPIDEVGQWVFTVRVAGRSGRRFRGHPSNGEPSRQRKPRRCRNPVGSGGRRRFGCPFVGQETPKTPGQWRKEIGFSPQN